MYPVFTANELKETENVWLNFSARFQELNVDDKCSPNMHLHCLLLENITGMYIHPSWPEGAKISHENIYETKIAKRTNQAEKLLVMFCERFQKHYGDDKCSPNACTCTVFCIKTLQLGLYNH